MSKIEQGLRGAIRLEISGADPRAALNACASAGIALMEMESIDSCTLRVTVFERERERVNRLAGSCYCDCKTIRRFGGSALRALLRRRAALLGLMGTVIVTLLISSLFIWDFEVVGCEKLTRGEVLRALSECGVDIGSYWPKLSQDELRSSMLLKLPELAWMTVNVQGSRAEILLLERAERPEIYQEWDAADIVAGKDGIVCRMSVLNGKSLVTPGQAVTRGEVLVSSVMDSITSAPRDVRAEAEVWADTWYEITALCPSQMPVKTDVGHTRNRFAIIVGKNRINFYLHGGKPIDECDKIVHEYIVGIRGLFSLPVSFVREELIPYRTQETERDLTEQMQQRLYDSLSEWIDGEVLTTGFSVAESDGLSYVTLRAHCLENIALIEDKTQAELPSPEQEEPYDRKDD